LQRDHQSLEKLVHWKASEFRSFLYYLSLILLRDVLAPEYYHHFSAFVKGVALLNSSSISPEDLLTAGNLLTQFVSEFEGLYGIEHMSHNLHMCLHLDLLVKNLGPLWAVSCFQFEDMNGRLKNLVHGTRHVGLQIYSKLSIITDLPLMINKLREGPAKEFCENLRRKYRLKIVECISVGVYCVGLFSAVDVENAWVVGVLRRDRLLFPISQVRVFCKLLQNRLLYVSSNYKRGKRNSSFCKYICGNSFKFGNIKLFVKVYCTCTSKCSCPNSKFFAVIKPVAVVPLSVNLNHIWKCDSSNVPDAFFNVDMVDIYDLQTVLYQVECEGETFLSEPLNNFELE
jgi:hypothetical protein